MERGERAHIPGDADVAETTARPTARESDAPASGRGDPPAVTVFICTTCRSPGEGESPVDGAVLADAAAAALLPDGVAVKGVRCLANCKRSLSAAMVRRDGWTYVFGDLAADAAPDLIAGAALLASSSDGLMPWRGRPESLKRGMVARIPPLSFPEEP
ncbi:DUF1636 family protein [Xanthobacter autotrophicus]|uniref:DUF1636 family protein n=1 Tax=Xanthobacter sp. AM33 TaxID=3380644 RepID=UPI0024AA4FDF|nr:DUF1636 family protein [Xanthobacter autotrophicus]MDI4665869.1 DUF1636 family protein [Xanthobacter autotrophicus]